jgi:transcriptional regulator with XRE-family HTH domain
MIAGMGRPISPLQRKTNTPEEALGAVITDLRIKRKLSYQEVAAIAGCSDSHMNKIEHGTENPTLKTLRSIADFHRIKLSKMFSLAERKHDRSQAAKKGAKPKPS